MQERPILLPSGNDRRILKLERADVGKWIGHVYSTSSGNELYIVGIWHRLSDAAKYLYGYRTHIYICYEWNGKTFPLFQ